MEHRRSILSPVRRDWHRASGQQQLIELNLRSVKRGKISAKPAVPPRLSIRIKGNYLAMEKRVLRDNQLSLRKDGMQKMALDVFAGLYGIVPDNLHLQAGSRGEHWMQGGKHNLAGFRLVDCGRRHGRRPVFQRLRGDCGAGGQRREAVQESKKEFLRKVHSVTMLLSL
jgi:hypothetical protein